MLVIKNAVKKLREGRSDVFSGGICHMVLVYTGGGAIVNTNTACTAGLNGRDTGCKYIVSGVRPSDLDEDTLIAWYDYMINISAWSKAFVDRKPKAIVKRGYYVLKTHQPANIMVGGAIMFRKAWESPHLVKVWKSLVDNGVEHNTACALANLTSSTEGNISLQCGEGHTVAFSCFSLDSVANFYNKCAVNAIDSYYDLGKFNSIDTTFGDSGVVSFQHYVKKFVGSVEQPSIVNNPFHKSMVNNDSYNYPYKEGIRRLTLVATNLKELFQ